MERKIHWHEIFYFREDYIVDFSALETLWEGSLSPLSEKNIEGHLFCPNFSSR